MTTRLYLSTPASYPAVSAGLTEQMRMFQWRPSEVPEAQENVRTLDNVKHVSGCEYLGLTMAITYRLQALGLCNSIERSEMHLKP